MHWYRGGQKKRGSQRRVWGAKSLWAVGLVLAGGAASACGTSSAEPATAGTGAVTATEEPIALPGGLLQVPSAQNAEPAAEALRQALADNEQLAVILDLDHRAAALEVGLTLGNCQVFVFGNPNLGTALMQENILAGLDLPLRMLVSDDEQGRARITYEAPDHLRRRYALETVDAQLEMAAGALANLAGAASARAVGATEGQATGVEPAAGVVVVSTPSSAQQTLDRLLEALAANPMLEVFAQVDHQAAARSVDLELPFATVVVFGSAAVGTPLMEANDTVGLDLPLKVLVAQRDDETILAYSAPSFLAARHGGLSSQQQRLQGMEAAVAALVAGASGGPTL